MRTVTSYMLKAAAIAGLFAVANCAMAQAPFPNINDAEYHLQAAIDSLHRAPPEFRGHKAEAARMIRAAISELEVAKQVAE